MISGNITDAELSEYVTKEQFCILDRLSKNSHNLLLCFAVDEH